MMTRKALERLCDQIYGLAEPYSSHLEQSIQVFLDHDQAQREVIEQLRALCSEVYQVVGSLANDVDLFEHPATSEVLDNLSAAGLGAPLPHKDLLPYPTAPKIEQQAKEIERLKEVAESWRNIQQEEICYTMREVEALGIDFNKSVMIDGRALWDVCMERITELRKAEAVNQALREALQAIVKIRFLLGNDPKLNPAYEMGDIAQQALKEVS